MDPPVGQRRMRRRVSTLVPPGGGTGAMAPTMSFDSGPPAP